MANQNKTAWTLNVLVLGSLLNFWSPPCAADDFFWINPAGGDVSDPENWSPEGVPGFGDVAIFNLGTDGYELKGFGYLIEARVNNDMLIGMADTSRLSIGFAEGSEGVLSLIDSDVDVNVLDFPIPDLRDGGLWVGEHGNGTLNLSSSIDVNVIGHIVVGDGMEAVGQIIMDGAVLGEPGFSTGDRQLVSTTIARGGTGSLVATNGSEVNLNGTFVVGQNAGSEGMVTVDDSRLGTLEVGSPDLMSTTVGAAGSGSLAATNGAELNLRGVLTVGRDAGSQGVVTVEDSYLYGSFQSPTTIGAAGTGSLAATNGSELEFGILVVGQEVGSQGAVTFDASELFGGGLSIGAAGTGSLTVANRSVIVIGRLSVGQQDGSRGNVTIDNSVFVANETYVGGSYTSEGGSGTLLFTEGAQADVGYMQVWPGGSVEIDSSTVDAFQVVNNGVVHVNGILNGRFDNGMGGVLSGTGTIGDNVHLNAGSQIIPGNSPGNLTLGTTLWAGDATFRFMINRAEGDAGIDPGWNSMHTLGFLILRGSPTDPMRVSLMSLLPDNEVGDVFDFNPEKSYLWTFATATDGIYGFSPESFVVDPTDFSNPVGSGYFEVRQIGNSLAVAYVPEPSTLVLAVIGAIGLLARARRKSHCGRPL